MHTTHPFIYICTCIYTGFFHFEKTKVKKCLLSVATQGILRTIALRLCSLRFIENMEYSTIYKGTSTDARRRKQERSGSAHRVISWHGVDNQVRKRSRMWSCMHANFGQPQLLKPCRLHTHLRKLPEISPAWCCHGWRLAGTRDAVPHRYPVDQVRPSRHQACGFVQAGAFAWETAHCGTKQRITQS